MQPKNLVFERTDDGVLIVQIDGDTEDTYATLRFDSPDLFKEFVTELINVGTFVYSNGKHGQIDGHYH